jgi:hypothetical protein
MDPAWYYVRDGVQTGPVSFEEMKSAAAAGRLSPADLVWQEGTADWVPARTVPGLFAGAGAPPPLPAAGAPEPLPPDDSPRRKRTEPLPPGDYADGRSPGRAGEMFALATVFLRRATDPNPATIAPNAAEEDRLTQAGIADPTARRYAVWRRAVLWVAVLPTAFAAFFGFINAFATETEMFSGFGLLVMTLDTLGAFALPASAVMAALAYDRPRHSARWVLLGAAVSIGLPVAIAFIPGSWLVSVPMTADERQGFGLIFSIILYLTIMPMVLSLLPAVSRACVRVKSFLPQSLVPGWGLVACAPLFVLLTLATFILFYQVVGNVLLLAGLLLWIGAPLFYLTKFRLLTRPVTHRRDLDSLARTQVGVLALITSGIVLIIIFLFTAKLGGMALMGTSKSTSILQPWSLDIHEKWIEFVGRSLFMTVFFADLITRMALSVWREERAFAGSEGAAAFDRTMTGLTENLGRKSGE